MTSTALKTKSAQIYTSLCEVIPGGVNSPVRAFSGLSVPPIIAESANGGILTDVDGRQLIDYCMSWGALILGHANPLLLSAVKKRIDQGTSFGVSTEIEEKLARKVTQLVPSIEKVRFVSSGTEATMSAVRLARGYTGRDIIVKFNGCYHGHADHFLVNAGSGVTHLNASASSAGVPSELVQHTISLPYNSVTAVTELFGNSEFRDRIAAVIVEPIAGNMGVVPGSPAFLRLLREVTQKSGALLIFDEVISGFRVAAGGAQQLYKITPDMTTLGKIVGGGFPAAAFGGRAEIMDHLAPLGQVYQAGTLSGNPVAMEAGYQQLSALSAPDFYEELAHKTETLLAPVREALADTDSCIQQVGSMFTIFIGRKSVRNGADAQALNQERFREFFAYLLDHGIYAPPSPCETWFISTAHTEEQLKKTADVIVKYFAH